jgi:hypothetical protein
VASLMLPWRYSLRLRRRVFLQSHLGTAGGKGQKADKESLGTNAKRGRSMLSTCIACKRGGGGGESMDKLV